ncbi:MAG: DUF6020 family protein [Oscillospiraceae bacterium]|nr:DUF6020 family protein [Oscillospiraceae bacterium]
MLDEKNASKTKVIKIFLALFSVWGTVSVLGVRQNAVVVLCFAFFTFWAFNKYVKCPPNIKLWGNLYGIVFTMALYAGTQIDYTVMEFLPFTLKNAVQAVGLGIFICTATGVLLNFAAFALPKRFALKAAPALTYKTWAFYFVPVFVVFLGYLLAFYPCIYAADSVSSLRQAMGALPLHNHHPVAFALFIRACMLPVYRITGSFHIAAAFFTLVQQFIMALILSYTLFYMRKKGVSAAVCGLGLIFYCTSPVLGVYSTVMWKDNLFSVFLLGFSLCVYEAVDTKGAFLKRPRGLVLYSGFALLTAFFRNNGYLVIAAVTIALAVYLYWKRAPKATLAAFAVLLIAVPVIQGPIYGALGISQGSFAESLSIPLQQMGYTVSHGGTISQTQLEDIEKIMPIDKMAQAYRTTSSDPIKFSADFDDGYVNENKGSVLGLWARMLPRNLNLYVKAYLLQTSGFWGIQTPVYYSSDSLDGFLVGENTAALSDMWQRTLHISGRSVLDRYLQSYVDATGISFFVRPAVCIWLALFAVALLFVKRKGKYVLALLPLIVLWTTLMVATPVAQDMRYFFLGYLILPCIFGLFAVSGAQTEKQA